MLQMKWKLTITCISSYTRTFWNWDKMPQHWFLFRYIVNNYLVCKYLDNLENYSNLANIPNIAFQSHQLCNSNLQFFDHMDKFQNKHFQLPEICWSKLHGFVQCVTKKHVINEIHLLSLGCYSCNLKPRKTVKILCLKMILIFRIFEVWTYLDKLCPNIGHQGRLFNKC